MPPKHCDEHSQISFQVQRLTMRMDRLEIGIVAVLIGIIVQMWMIWDLPTTLRQDRKEQLHRLVPPAVAQG